MTVRIASRYAAALQEARKGTALARRTIETPLNFGDHMNPDELVKDLLEKAARLSAAAGHYQAAATAVRGRQEPEGDGW